MEPDRETAKEIGGGPASVINALLGSGVGGITLWGRDLGFVGVEVPESGGSSRGLSHTYERAEVKAAEVQDL